MQQMEIKLHYVLILQENKFILCDLSTRVISRCPPKINELQNHKTSLSKDLNQCKRSGSQNSFLLHIDVEMHCHSKAGLKEGCGDGQQCCSLPATASYADSASSFGWGGASQHSGLLELHTSLMVASQAQWALQKHTVLVPGANQRGKWTGDILCILQLKWGRRAPGCRTPCFVFFLHCCWVTLGVIVLFNRKWRGWEKRWVTAIYWWQDKPPNIF